MNSLNYILTILAIGYMGFVQAQVTVIPDPIFEQYLIDFGFDSDGIINGQVLTSDIDFRTSLFINETSPIYPINDLTGIQDFAAVEYIQMNDVLAQVIDFGSLTNLQTLDCGYNPNLIAVNIGQCINLESLVMPNNINLSSIVFPQSTSLEVIILASNKLTELDFSLYPNITSFIVGHNALTTLNIANGNNTNITNFNASNNPELRCIIVDDAAYSQANWTNIDATTTFVESQAACDALSTNEFNKNSLKLYPNPTSGYFVIENGLGFAVHSLKVLDLSGKTVAFFNEALSRYDVSKLTDGVYILILKTDAGIKTQKLIIE
ncbi:MAG: T9SS type A sorting domain-containing protein [Flavobacteriales bacterium]|nr:T9SS type A sorting domain-containing protein [Flavobacteriales bacterium]